MFGGSRRSNQVRYRGEDLNAELHLELIDGNARLVEDAVSTVALHDNAFALRLLPAAETVGADCAHGALGNAMQSGAGGPFVSLIDGGSKKGVELPFVLNGVCVGSVARGEETAGSVWDD